MLRKSNPLAFLLAVVILLGTVIIVRTPVARPIRSLEETEALLAQLGLQWNGAGVPVIVFTSPGCPASQSLEAELQRQQVYYLRVDITTNEVGREIHAWLGRNYLGTVATRATPTTVVGTWVIRGHNVDKILQAIAAQNQP